jgi:hypothetical protein
MLAVCGIALAAWSQTCQPATGTYDYGVRGDWCNPLYNDGNWIRLLLLPPAAAGLVTLFAGRRWAIPIAGLAFIAVFYLTAHVGSLSASSGG